jgi:uncharacterized membrane protein HdeD (DUF308 family)
MSHIEAFAARPACSLEPNWWVFALRGILGLMFGSLALFMPVAAVLSLALIFGAYATIDGALHLVAGLSLARKGRRWGGLVGSGVLGITAGLVTLIAPQLVALGLTGFLWTMVSCWVLVSGALGVATALRLRQESQGSWMLALGGMLSMLLGGTMAAIFWMKPLAALPALGLFIALNALVSSVLSLLLAFRLMQMARVSTRES